MEMMIWNIVLSAVVGIMGVLLKGKFDEAWEIVKELEIKEIDSIN